MIRQFDVVTNPIASIRRDRPYLLCIQHNNLNHLSVRVIASLATERIIPEPSRLHPLFVVKGATVILIPFELVSRPLKQLGTAIANLEADREKIIAALDLVFTGI